MAAPLLVFDLDGTMLDTAPDLVGALNVIMVEEGLPPVARETMRTNIGHGARAIIVEGLRQAGRTVDVGRLDTLTNRFLDLYAARIADETVPFPGFVEAMDRLAPLGVRFAVCTNKRAALARTLLDGLGLLARFDAVLGGDSLSVRKPHPDHLLGTLDAAGGHRNAAVMVGDSDADVAAAKAAGVPVVGVSFGYSPDPIESYGPDVVIDHFDEIDRALAAISPAFAAVLASEVTP